MQTSSLLEGGEHPGLEDGPGGDPGSLARALELVLAGLDRPDGRRAFGGSAIAGAVGRGGMGELARALESQGLVARVRRLDANGLRRTVLGGVRAMVRVDADWLVLHGRRATLVGAGTESTVGFTRRALRRVGVDAAVDVILVEPRLALAPLASSAEPHVRPWARLRAFMSLDSAELASLVVYAIVIGGLSLAVPIAAQVLVNNIAFGSLFQPLVVLVILLAAALTFSGGVQLVQWYAVEVLQRRVFVRVAEDFSRRLAAATLELGDRFDRRELANRFFEVVGIQKTMSGLLLDGLGLALQTAIGLLLLAFYHPVLLAFDAVLVLALTLIFAFGSSAVPTAIDESRAKYRVAAWLETVAAGATAFKRSDAATFAALEADALVRDYLSARRRHYVRILRQLAGGLAVQIFAMVALLGLGGWLVIRGELTLGQLVAAELVVGVIGAGFAKVGKQLESLYDLLASLDKLGKVLDLPIDPVGRVAPERALTQLQARGLVARPGLAPVDLALEAGDRVRIEGAGASGKSSLLETLAGLRRAHAGAIAIEHTDDPAGLLRERAMLVRPDDVLTEGSVLDNLRVADPLVDEDRAWQALRAVELDRAVGALEHGLRTRVSATTGPLSSSERARLALARAWLARPDLLLLDGVLDRLGLEEPALSRVLDRVLGPEAPWIAVVVGSDRSVAARCRAVVSMRREEAA